MGWEKLLKQVGTVAAGAAIDGAYKLGREQLEGAAGSGGGSLSDWVAATFPAARKAGRGVYVVGQHAGGRMWQLTVYEVAGSAVLRVDSGLRVPAQDQPAAALAAVLGRNDRSVYPKWCLTPDGRQVGLTCQAAMPVGTAADLAREVASLLAREVAEVSGLLV